MDSQLCHTMDSQCVTPWTVNVSHHGQSMCHSVDSQAWEQEAVRSSAYITQISAAPFFSHLDLEFCSVGFETHAPQHILPQKGTAT